MRSLISCVTQPGHNPEYFSWWPPSHTNIHWHTHLHPSLTRTQRNLKPVVPYCLLITLNTTVPTNLEFNTQSTNSSGWTTTQNIWPWLYGRFVFWNHQQKNSAPTHCPLPTAQLPTPPTSLLYLSCPKQVSTTQKSSLDTAWQRERFQSASFLCKGYIFVSISCLNDWYWFQDMTSFGSLFCFRFILQVGYGGRSSDHPLGMAGCICSAGQPPESPSLTMKGWGSRLNRAPDPAQGNAVQITAVLGRHYWLYFQG